MATRSPIRPLVVTPEKIQAENAKRAAVKKERKTRSKKEAAPATLPVAPTVLVSSESSRAAEYAANALKAAAEDADALGVPVEQVLANMGLGPDGYPSLKPTKAPYTGPMLALRVARKAYGKAPNGQQCCGDQLSVLLGTLKPTQVIRSLLDAMKLEKNPYLHLNEGQQSMNLRNKARAMMKRGELSFDAIRQQVESKVEA